MLKVVFALLCYVKKKKIVPRKITFALHEIFGAVTFFASEKQNNVLDSFQKNFVSAANVSQLAYPINV